ncbi:bifunctional ADP-dependent NAD(P)H-hydrate dehydratase/NAD(P)H-hydrate epimerase [Leisingera aquaemixtae]|uniref:Bifunctional NAD(P)H-hydrate repair enzyme n=1 Tax=Leisingera aquaemixtae TaxID=1396826 RepID=A0A0P1HCP8_9RHOB|nr:bifunctional ADP-dependent NAD(P)H-hydrate dehydratase/NAD(P)H-hydrate epimerase [Leisingera aquaemixtae]CUI01048.1 Nicotinamide nucleotide repair protein [Leisingera aquaemixtae]
MTELLTAAQMRAIEQTAIESGEVTGLELMERAGQGVVEAIFEEWPELADERGPAPAPPEYLGKDEMPRRVVVLCGPGNNGGDGFVVARLLKERGWAVEVFLYGDPEKLPPDAKVNYERWRELGGVVQLTEKAVAQGQRPVLLVDAMFGTGLTRAIPLELANAYHAVEGRDVGCRHPWRVPYHRVAVDCPSGMDSDSGEFLIPDLPVDSGDEERDAEIKSKWWLEDASKRFLQSDLVVTFHRRKVCHGLHEGLRRERLVDIGLGQEDRHPSHLKIARSADLATQLSFDIPNGRSKRMWPGYDLNKSSRLGGHKYSHGHALVLSGGHGKTGAARLAARGALRIGAGLVTVGSPRSAMFENAANLNAIMLRQIDGAHGLAELLEDDRLSALCLGPGMGRGADTQAMVFAALKEQRPTVLDADALTRFELKPEALFEALHENCVITPHGGEFSRLFPDLAEKLKAPATTGPAYSKVDATREAAKRAGCVVLFKGPDTVIAAPDGRCSVNSAHYERSAPWLATAGSGDVLAGFITGLLARGFSPMQASETAAYIHVECALEFGPGLIAEDLPEQIPAVFRKLGL